MHLDFLEVVVNDRIDLREILVALLDFVNNVFFKVLLGWCLPKRC